MNRDELISRCSLLLARRFADDPIIQYQLEGVGEPDSILYWFFRSQLEAYDELGAVDYLEGARGCFAYYDTGKLPEVVVRDALVRKTPLLMKGVSCEDMRILEGRTKEISRVCRPKWYRKYWPGPVCSTEFVAIDPSLKGSGAFRELFISVVERYASKGIPVVGQTTNPDNVSIYVHCGFSVVEVLRCPGIPFSCYCVAVVPQA